MKPDHVEIGAADTILKNQEIIRSAWSERKLNMAQKKVVL